MTDHEAAKRIRQDDVEQVHKQLEKIKNILASCVSTFADPLTVTRNGETYGIEMPGLKPDDVSDLRDHINATLTYVSALSDEIARLTPPF